MLKLLCSHFYFLSHDIITKYMLTASFLNSLVLPTLLRTLFLSIWVSAEEMTSTYLLATPGSKQAISFASIIQIQVLLYHLVAMSLITSGV